MPILSFIQLRCLSGRNHEAELPTDTLIRPTRQPVTKQMPQINDDLILAQACFKRPKLMSIVGDNYNFRTVQQFVDALSHQLRYVGKLALQVFFVCSNQSLKRNAGVVDCYLKSLFEESLDQ